MGFFLYRIWIMPTNLTTFNNESHLVILTQRLASLNFKNQNEKLKLGDL